MLVSFLGAPCTGKSTTAFLLMSKFKEEGYPVEFVPELARGYIARKKLNRKKAGEVFTGLRDDDQLAILREQFKYEEALVASMEEVHGITISDTSCLNALLYFTQPGDGSLPSLWSNPEVKEIVEKVRSFKPLFFRPAMVELQGYSTGMDPNRIHNKEESKAVEQLIPKLEAFFRLDSGVPLVGGTAVRFAKAQSTVLGRRSSSSQAA